MAIRLRRSIQRGEIDNRTRGQVTGRIWLAGADTPIELALSGNCGADLAGCRLKFSNPQPIAQGDGNASCATIQQGPGGDMTASRKVRIPVEGGVEKMDNALYLEWFSEANGRVVIESADYEIEISTPAWQLTAAEMGAQFEASRQALRDWLELIAAPAAPESVEFEPWDPRDFDEFAYEKTMRESDALTDKYMELLEKYEDHPDQEQIVAREMGWEWMEDAIEARERGAIERPEDEDRILPEPPEPDPLTEGIDWIRGQDGSIRHPLSEPTKESAIAIWRYCSERNMLGKESDSDLQEMVFEFQTAGAKIAGALNSLGYDREPAFRSGFVVAALKRALGYIHKSNAAADRVAGKAMLPRERLEEFRAELFAIREEILRLMTRFCGES